MSTPAAASSRPTRDALGPPLGFTVLLALCGAGAAHEVLGVQPSLYLAAGAAASRWTALGLGLVGLAFGAFAANKLRDPFARLPWAPTIASLAVGSSGPLLFVAFGRGGPLEAFCLTLPVVTGLALGAVSTLAVRALGRTLSSLGAGARIANPFRLLGLILAAGLGVGIAAAIGPLRAALGAGMLLATLALGTAPLYAFLERRRLRHARTSRLVALLTLLVFGGAFVASEGVLPSSELARHSAAIIYYEASERSTLALTSGNGALELHIDGRLKVSSIDEKRYFEALVQPVMALAPRHARVLVLGGGTGLCEREVLRHGDVESVTVITVDRALALLAGRVDWLRRRSHDALASPKLRLIEAEPIVWLGEPERSERFDVIIVDLPDPEGYVEGKSYTRYFYRALARRLADDGVAVIQAASPFVSPRAFASLKATLESAELATHGYHAPVPTFGDWGFMLAFRVAPPFDRLGRALPYLSGVTLVDLGHLPRDVSVTEPVLPSTLYDQRIVEILQLERPPS